MSKYFTPLEIEEYFMKGSCAYFQKEESMGIGSAGDICFLSEKIKKRHLNLNHQDAIMRLNELEQTHPNIIIADLSKQELVLNLFIDTEEEFGIDAIVLNQSMTNPLYHINYLALKPNSNDISDDSIIQGLNDVYTHG